VGSWFEGVANSSLEERAANGDELHVVLASLSRLAMVKPLPEPAVAAAKVAAGGGAGTSLAASVLASTSGALGKLAPGVNEQARDKDTILGVAAVLNESRAEVELGARTQRPGPEEMYRQRGAGAGSGASAVPALEGGERTQGLLDDELAVRPLVLGEPASKVKHGSIATAVPAVLRDSFPLAAVQRESAKPLGGASGTGRPPSIPGEATKRMPVGKSISSGSLGGRTAMVGGMLLSKSVSSNSLGGAQAHGPPRREDGGGAEGVGGADSARSGVGVTGDGKSSKWQFKFELSGLAAPPVVAGGSGSANTSSVGTTEVASLRAPGERKG
jgi:hypothetical protein